MDETMSLVRQAIESTYNGLCNISEYVEYEDPETEEKKSKLEPIHEDIACKLSKKTINSTNQTDVANVIRYSPLLFINSDIEIKPGSQIDVNQHGITRSFKQSGEPFIYETHQEIILQRVDNS